jgi:hypothetical protein
LTFNGVNAQFENGNGYGNGYGNGRMNQMSQMNQNQTPKPKEID